jgi:hypothetical protein
VINGLTFDGATQDPMQMAVLDALIGFMAATAQAQAEATKEAQRAGIEHAKAHGESYRASPTRSAPSTSWFSLGGVGCPAGSPHHYPAAHGLTSCLRVLTVGFALPNNPNMPK